MRTVFIGVILMVLSNAVTNANEKELLTTVDKYEEAANTGNIALFEKVLALDDPQFSEFEDFIPNLIGRKGVYDILNWRKEHPEFKYEVAYINRKAFLLNETVGYVTALSRSKSDHGVGNGRVTFIMKNTDDGWRIIHGHWSEQPKVDKEK